LQHILRKQRKSQEGDDFLVLIFGIQTELKKREIEIFLGQACGLDLGV
jgi:hypothetical protein